MPPPTAPATRRERAGGATRRDHGDGAQQRGDDDEGRDPEPEAVVGREERGGPVHERLERSLVVQRPLVVRDTERAHAVDQHLHELRVVVLRAQLVAEERGEHDRRGERGRGEGDDRDADRSPRGGHGSRRRDAVVVVIDLVGGHRRAAARGDRLDPEARRPGRGRPTTGRARRRGGAAPRRSRRRRTRTRRRDRRRRPPRRRRCARATGGRPDASTRPAPATASQIASCVDVRGPSRPNDPNRCADIEQVVVGVVVREQVVEAVAQQPGPERQRAGRRRSAASVGRTRPPTRGTPRAPDRSTSPSRRRTRRRRCGRAAHRPVACRAPRTSRSSLGRAGCAGRRC